MGTNDELDCVAGTSWDIAGALLNISRLLSDGCEMDTVQRVAPLLAAVADRVAIVSATTQALGTTVEPAELVHIMARELRSRLTWATMVLARYDESAGDYALVGWEGELTPLVAGDEVPRPLMPCPPGELTSSTRPYYVPDTRRSALETAAQCARHGVLCAVCVPLWAQGRHAGCLGLFADRAEAYSQAQLVILSDVAPHLAAALINTQLHKDLQVAYEQLQEAHDHLVSTERLRTLGSIAAGISHDFNNLLAVVLGQAQLGQLETEDEGVLQRLREIEAAATQGAASVRRLAEFAGRAGGEAPTEVDVAAIAQQSLDVTRARWKDHAEARGILIRTRIAVPSGLRVFAAPSAVRDVLVSLILNAAEALNRNGEIVIAARAAGDRVFISVSDTGSGMEDAILAKAPEPFFTTRGPKRLGIGLPVVQTIVARHGGKLSLASTPGEGTTATVDFPLAEAHDQRPEQLAPSTGRVYVIEDNEALLSLIRQLLAGAGMEVEAFSSGIAAIEACRQRMPDVVFTDLGMAEMTGWQVAAKVRELDPTVSVVMLTGWGSTLSAEDAKKRGVDVILAKPVDSQTLIGTVKKALAMRVRNAGQQRASSAHRPELSP